MEESRRPKGEYQRNRGLLEAKKTLLKALARRGIIEAVAAIDYYGIDCQPVPSQQSLVTKYGLKSAKQVSVWINAMLHCCCPEIDVSNSAESRVRSIRKKMAREKKLKVRKKTRTEEKKSVVSVSAETLAAREEISKAIESGDFDCLELKHGRAVRLFYNLDGINSFPHPQQVAEILHSSRKTVVQWKEKGLAKLRGMGYRL